MDSFLIPSTYTAVISKWRSRWCWGWWSHWSATWRTPYFSVYDLQDPKDDGDIFERLASSRLSRSAEDTVIRAVTMDCLCEEFLQLSKKGQDILGRYFGVYAFHKSDLRVIAMRNRIREDGVEKAKN